MNDFQYNNIESYTDTKLTEMIGSFIKQQRLAQNKSQTEVAEAAGISRSTLSLLERGEKVSLTTLLRVMRVLELLYILKQFKIQEEISPIQMAKLEKKKRQRARKTGKKDFEIDW